VKKYCEYFKAAYLSRRSNDDAEKDRIAKAVRDALRDVEGLKDREYTEMVTSKDGTLTEMAVVRDKQIADMARRIVELEEKMGRLMQEKGG